MNCGWLIKRFVFLGRVWMNLPQFIPSCCAFKCDIFGMRFVCLLSAFYDGHKTQVVCFIKKENLWNFIAISCDSFLLLVPPIMPFASNVIKRVLVRDEQKEKWRTHKKCSRKTQKPSSEMPLNFSITFVCVWHTDVLFI